MTGGATMTTVTAAKPAAKLLSAEEFYDFTHRPENENRFFELVRGEVIEMPSPKMVHGLVAGNAYWHLKKYSNRMNRGFVLSNDSGVVLDRNPDTVRGPDVAFYDRNMTYQQIKNLKYSEFVPTLVVEVLSPEERESRLNRKLRDYLRAGVSIIWVILTEDCQVTVYRPSQDFDVFDETGTLEGYDALPGLSVPVVELFQLRSQGLEESGGAG
jgi:Uma2 family endonuclease